MSEQNNIYLIKEPVGRVMNKISRSFLTVVHQRLSGLDLERSFYPLLVIEAGEGNLTQNELAQKLSCDKVQVVRIIDYLESTGYVERVINAEDRRKYNLRTTEKAKKYMPEIRKALHETAELAFRNISDNKVEELYEVLRIIEKNLSDY